MSLFVSHFPECKAPGILGTYFALDSQPLEDSVLSFRKLIFCFGLFIAPAACVVEAKPGTHDFRAKAEVTLDTFEAVCSKYFANPKRNDEEFHAAFSPGGSGFYQVKGLDGEADRIGLGDLALFRSAKNLPGRELMSTRGRVTGGTFFTLLGEDGVWPNLEFHQGFGAESNTQAKELVSCLKLNFEINTGRSVTLGKSELAVYPVSGTPLEGEWHSDHGFDVAINMSPDQVGFDICTDYKWSTGVQCDGPVIPGERRVFTYSTGAESAFPVPSENDYVENNGLPVTFHKSPQVKPKFAGCKFNIVEKRTVFDLELNFTDE